MARYIHCEECKNMFVKLSAEENELYEFIEGTALRAMICDGCGKPVEKCFAAVLLNNNKHFNYEKQKPEVWAHEFIEVGK